MLSNMAAPYETLILETLNFLNYSYFAKIMTKKPKNLTKVTELYPFLESRKWLLLLKGFCGDVTSHENQEFRCVGTIRNFLFFPTHCWDAELKLVAKFRKLAAEYIIHTQPATLVGDGGIFTSDIDSCTFKLGHWLSQHLAYSKLYLRKCSPKHNRNL